MENGGGPGARKSFLALFGEIFEGPESQEGMFLAANTGIHKTLAGIDSESASQDVCGSSVAAHAAHLMLYLEVLGGYLKGEIRGVDWTAGWAKTTVDPEEWDTIRAGIRRECGKIEVHADKINEWDADMVSLTMALTIHSAYHLGAIRQIAKHL